MQSRPCIPRLPGLAPLRSNATRGGVVRSSAADDALPQPRATVERRQDLQQLLHWAAPEQPPAKQPLAENPPLAKLQELREEIELCKEELHELALSKEQLKELSKEQKQELKDQKKVLTEQNKELRKQETASKKEVVEQRKEQNRQEVAAKKQRAELAKQKKAEAKLQQAAAPDVTERRRARSTAGQAFKTGPGQLAGVMGKAFVDPRCVPQLPCHAGALA